MTRHELVAVALVAAATWIGIAQSARLDDAALTNAWRSGQWATYGNDLAERRYSPLDRITAVKREPPRAGVDLPGRREVAAIRKQRRSSGTAPSTASPTGASSLPWTRARARTVALRPAGGSHIRDSGPEPGHLLRRGQPRHRAVRRCRDLPGHRRPLSRSMRPRAGALVNADPSGRFHRLLDHDGAAHREGKAIVGVAGGEFTPHRGFFVAIDVNSGRELWRFYTVPGDPSKPFENPRWPPPRKRGRASGGNTAAAVRCGTASPTTPRQT